MRKAVQFYRLLNTLSLDVVAGALVCALFFARIFEVVIALPSLAGLLLTVWIIYTADHLWDAKNIGQSASTARHRFHQRHFRKIIVILIVMIILDIFTLFFMDAMVLKWGALLMALVSIYLISHRYLKVLKEIFIAVMYTCGIILPALSVATRELTVMHGVLIGQFAILALINLLLFSWFDRELDQQDNQHSFVTTMGVHFTTITIWLLILFEALCTVIQVVAITLRGPAMVVGSMSIALLLILVFRDKISENDYFRFLGDAVFLVPVFYLL